MANLIKFQTKWIADDGTIFYEWSEWEYIDTYEAIREEEDDSGLDEGTNRYINDCQGLYVRYYRVERDSIIYSIPEDVITIIDRNTNTNYPEGVRQAWQDEVTRDELLNYYDKEDYVKATKDFLGIDIGAKKRADKADYAQESRFNQLKALQSKPSVRQRESVDQGEEESQG